MCARLEPSTLLLVHAFIEPFLWPFRDQRTDDERWQNTCEEDYHQAQTGRTPWRPGVGDAITPCCVDRHAPFYRVLAPFWDEGLVPAMSAEQHGCTKLTPQVARSMPCVGRRSCCG